MDGGRPGAGEADEGVGEHRVTASARRWAAGLSSPRAAARSERGRAGGRWGRERAERRARACTFSAAPTVNFAGWMEVVMVCPLRQRKGRVVEFCRAKT